jgi:dTDP-4-amino-4,6-dideoxygalactose transaminase
MTPHNVPFFRPDIRQAEIDEVVDTLRSGWLTTGPKVHAFEQSFAAAVHADDALAVNSCTAALHLAVEALGTHPGDAILVPTMTFAATAEVVRYAGAIPVLVDCDPATLNMDLEDGEEKAAQVLSPMPPANLPHDLRLTGIMPVHVGGLMLDMDAVGEFAGRHGLWIVEDAAHAFPAAWRTACHSWQRCGEASSAVTCFSFYANKTMTTGEGGMAVTRDQGLMKRMRVMALHGLSADAWQRYSTNGTWDYRITAPGFKYNLTDIAAAIGVQQLARAEEMRAGRERIARRYLAAFEGLDEIELPPDDEDRIQSWHLFAIKLRLDRLAIDRAEFIRELSRRGIGTSVHWRPLHLHPYYRDTFGWRAGDFPVATRVWERLISLPIFSAMNDADVEAVTRAVRQVCETHAKTALPVPQLAIAG